MKVREILQKYELHSGQAINFQKSGIYFSSNVRLDKQGELKDLLGVHSDLSTGRYLGLPSLIGRSKKTAFNYLKDRLWSKIQGWSAKCLSKAGKAVLLRSIAQAVPSYAMSCFLLLKSLCTDLEKMMNSYWWGSQDSNRKGIKWVSWTNMSMAKEVGGLAFRDLQGFNLALLGKQCWNLMANSNSLVARVFKAKYYPGSSLFDATRGGGVSYVWSGLWQAKEHLKQGYRWIVGDGRSISVSTDPWIRGKAGFRIDEHNSSLLSGLKVSDLLVPGSNTWDDDKVHSLFSNCDAKCILAIPVPQNQDRRRTATKWQAPREGRLKVNVDAHVVAGCPWFSCGLVLRNHAGKFIRARTHKFIGAVPVIEAEVTGVWEAIKWVKSLGLQNVDIESDSLVAVQAINNAVENLLEVGVVMQACSRVLKSRKDIVVSFIKKQANKVAHLVTRVPCEASCFFDLMTPPLSVLEPLENDCLMN
ncbi:hypothetical protein AgCh_017989 [Apium graveolens]